MYFAQIFCGSDVGHSASMCLHRRSGYRFLFSLIVLIVLPVSMLLRLTFVPCIVARVITSIFCLSYGLVNLTCFCLSATGYVCVSCEKGHRLLSAFFVGAPTFVRGFVTLIATLPFAVSARVLLSLSFFSIVLWRRRCCLSSLVFLLFLLRCLA